MIKECCPPRAKPKLQQGKPKPIPRPLPRADAEEFDYIGRVPPPRKPTRTESIRAASLAEYGDADYVRALHEIIRTKGHPRPIWPGRDAWTIVRGTPDVISPIGSMIRRGTGDPDFAAYLESLKSDADWFALAPEGRSRRRTASSALGDGARANRQRRVAEARAAAEAAVVEAELDDFDPAEEDLEEDGGSGGGPGALPVPVLKLSPRS